MDIALLLPPAVLLAAGLATALAIVATVYQIRKDRLPAATRHADLAVRNELLTRQVAEATLEYDTLKLKMRELDHITAETAALEQRRDVVRAEWNQLADARSEISRVKAEAAEAAGEYAARKQELQEATRALEQAKSELGNLTDPEALSRLRTEVAKLEQDRNRFHDELDQLRVERLAAQSAIAQARDLEAAIAGLEVEHAVVQRDLERDEARREELRALEQMLNSLQAEFEARRAVLEELEEKVARLRAQKAQLEADLSAREIGSDEDHRDRLVGDLLRLPDCLGTMTYLRGAAQTETEALADVDGYLRGHQLAYSRGTVRAFHTALKINDNAQLTVLAGVSGTGKSLLPRRYAEAMGIHFLQIAVEPRWDSPQDLLGFYNYIEKRYRATDLARLLVYMDKDSPLHHSTAESDYSDHIAIVLLDEMNLARVEYYFSEFLSRLEMRPAFSDCDLERRRGAQIPVDIRGLNEQISLFPGHNVLFVGTMNDDESTQALSDKVLDRGNVMQFAAPEFNRPTARAGNRASQSSPEPLRKALPFHRWRNWCRRASDLSTTDREVAEEVIRLLADIMEKCERPFGHRLRDAILTYVANYPRDGHGPSFDLRPLSDQVELRIMPRLRGLSLDGHAKALDELDDLIRRKLNDSALADEFNKLRERQSSGSGLFSWRGLVRRGE